jgi:DNA-binding response OmpR family regulator
VWGNDLDGSERTLDAHTGRLRERFPAESAASRIATVRGPSRRPGALLSGCSWALCCQSA